jgi:hypothetical protein
MPQKSKIVAVLTLLAALVAGALNLVQRYYPEAPASLPALTPADFPQAADAGADAR